MSDIPLGANRKQASLEDTLVDLSKTMKQMTGFMGAMYESVGGDKDKAKKFNKSIGDFFNSQKKREDLEKKYGNNYDELIRMVKVISNDTHYQAEQAKLNRQAGKDKRQLQDKFIGGNILDHLSKNSAWMRMLTGRHPDLPGSAKERQHDLQDKLDYAYKGKSDQQGNDPYLRMKAAGLQLKENGITNSPGKVEVSESEVAKLPFGISGPAELLHVDLKHILKKLGGENEFEGLVNKSGGGGIGGLIGEAIPNLVKMLPTLLEAAIPLLVTGGIIALILAAVTSATNSEEKRRKGERDKLIKTITPEEVIKLKAKGKDKDLTDVKTSLETIEADIIELRGRGSIEPDTSSMTNPYHLIALGNGGKMPGAQALPGKAGGGAIPKTGPYQMHKGEIVLNPNESEGFRKNIQTLVDKASEVKPETQNNNRELVDLLKKNNEAIEKLLIETTKGNDILTNKEFKGGEKNEKTPIPIAKVTVNESN
jgi:hypothetical protein